MRQRAMPGRRSISISKIERRDRGEAHCGIPPSMCMVGVGTVFKTFLESISSAWLIDQDSHDGDKSKDENNIQTLHWDDYITPAN